MIASDLIGVIPPLKATDSVQKAFDRMNEFRVNHLPLVNGQVYVGLLSYEDIIELPDFSSSVGDVYLSITNGCVEIGRAHV